MKLPERYGEYLTRFEDGFSKLVANMDFDPSILGESIRYSLLGGGKRVRPVLFYAMLSACGVDYEKELNFAAALECVHTYSLIHDDLPAMDNDDYRRGRLSNHKVFGEANAILAGDALLSFAFDLLLKEGARGEKYLNGAQILSKAAGAEGMIAGQSYDLLATGATTYSPEDLLRIYELKTGALIAAPLMMAAEIAGKNIVCAREYGKNLGILFQMTDDLLDVLGTDEEVGKTLGKDEKEDKLTCVKVFGLEKSQKLCENYAKACKDALTDFEGDSSFFAELVDYIRDRRK